MDFQALVEGLEQVAANVKPIPVPIPGIGTLYIRKRTVLEYEEMSDIRRLFSDEDNESSEKKPGMLAISLARLLCKQDGSRYSLEEQKKLAPVLAKQPEDVFHKLLNASDDNPVENIKGKSDSANSSKPS